MDYTPRHRQPFTLTEAKALDVPIITEEIARLQDSIRRLRNTQAALREIISSTPVGDVADLEYELAIKENDEVIDSQEERIGMLRLVLSEKGIAMEHHGAPVSESGRQQPQLAPSELVAGSPMNNRPRVEEASSENDGVYL